MDKGSPDVLQDISTKRPKTITLPIGTILFANDENETLVSVGYFAPWRRVGWIAKNDLLDGVFQPLTFGELKHVASTMGFESVVGEVSNVAGRTVRSDALFVRALSQPERRTTIGSFPGDSSIASDALKTWGWHYVFDIELHEGKPWILLGKNRLDVRPRRQTSK